jgi:predicted NACHT family NTPase
MKQQIDQLVAQDEQLQAFLAWVSQKSRDVAAPDRLAIVRAFYLDLDLARVFELVGGTLDLARTLDSNITRELDCDLALDLALDRTLALNRVLDFTLDPRRAIHRVLSRAIARVRVVVLARAMARVRVVAPELEHEFKPSALGESLQQLKEQISDADKDGKGFEVWWKAHGQAWTEQLRAAMVYYRNIGYNWQFSAQQKEVLKQYYDANQLLVDCLNSHCYVTRAVREEILETLLLPMAEIKQQKALVLK